MQLARTQRLQSSSPSVRIRAEGLRRLLRTAAQPSEPGWQDHTALLLVCRRAAIANVLSADKSARDRGFFLEPSGEGPAEAGNSALVRPPSLNPSSTCAFRSRRRRLHRAASERTSASGETEYFVDRRKVAEFDQVVESIARTAVVQVRGTVVLRSSRDRS